MESEEALHGAFRSRGGAATLLADAVSREGCRNALVLAVPRGGVVIGQEVAEKLSAELDIITPRKLRDPWEPELAIGAVMHDGSMFLNDEVLSERKIPMQYVEREMELQVSESKRRLHEYRGKRKSPVIGSRNIVIVDDGIATGATATVAARWLRLQKPKAITLAVPVMPKSLADALGKEVDGIICLASSDAFYGIGQFYEEFGQVADQEVIGILNRYWRTHSRLL